MSLYDVAKILLDFILIGMHCLLFLTLQLLNLLAHACMFSCIVRISIFTLSIYIVQSNFYTQKLLKDYELSSPSTCEGWRVSIARTLTVTSDDTRRKMLNILV